MTLKEYIDSGILEAYVLKLLPQDEMEDVSLKITQFPSIREEKLIIEASLFRYSKTFQTKMSKTVSEKVLSNILKKIAS